MYKIVLDVLQRYRMPVTHSDEVLDCVLGNGEFSCVSNNCSKGGGLTAQGRGGFPSGGLPNRLSRLKPTGPGF